MHTEPNNTAIITIVTVLTLLMIMIILITVIITLVITTSFLGTTLKVPESRKVMDPSPWCELWEQRLGILGLRVHWVCGCRVLSTQGAYSGSCCIW